MSSLNAKKKSVWVILAQYQASCAKDEAAHPATTAICFSPNITNYLVL